METKLCAYLKRPRIFKTSFLNCNTYFGTSFDLMLFLSAAQLQQEIIHQFNFIVAWVKRLEPTILPRLVISRKKYCL